MAIFSWRHLLAEPWEQPQGVVTLDTSQLLGRESVEPVGVGDVSDAGRFRGGGPVGAEQNVIGAGDYQGRHPYVEVGVDKAAFRLS
jgi:hypothetical protein